MQIEQGKVICVAGVSNKPEKFGYRIFVDLLKAGFKVQGINPADGEVAGQKIYRSLRDLPGKPNLLITVVPHQVTERLVEEAHGLGIKELWMQPGSESELAIQKAKDHGMAVTHNACFMVEMGIW